jgi:type III secretion control protein HpaP
MSKTRSIFHRPGATVIDLAPASQAPMERAGRQAPFSELLKQRRLPVPLLVDDDESAAETPEPPLDEREDHPQLPQPPRVGRGEREPQKPLADALPLFVPAPTTRVPAELRVEAPWHKVVHDVAHTIAAFCNDKAVNTSEGWSVQMALRPDVVADTTLHLTLSLHWLTLRFHARDPSSRELLSKGQQDLVGILEASLARKREIVISFEPS